LKKPNELPAFSTAAIVAVLRVAKETDDPALPALDTAAQGRDDLLLKKL